jgi:hypothetical protein
MKGTSVLQAYRLGIERGLWTSQNACARCINVAPSTFRLHVAGEGRESDSNETLRKVNDALSHAPKEEDIPPLKALYYKGIALELWATIAEASNALGINRCSLTKYLDMSGIDSCSTVRERGFYQGLEKKLRAKVRQAQSKHVDQPEERKPVQAPASPAPTTDTSLHMAQAMQMMVIMLAERIAQVLLEKGIERKDMPKEVPQSTFPAADSNWLDEVYAGRKELQGQSLPGVRFVLTAPPFAKLLKGMTSEERTDTKDLTKAIRLAIVELRRRLTLSAQTENATERERDLAVFGRELDELVIAITQAGDADICASAQVREQQRKELDDIRQLKPKKGS